MSWSAQFEKGWVPAAATRIPWRRARAMISPRSSATSLRTSWMFLQMPVPISMTDWCISGFTRSFRTRFPSSSISWTCDFNSRVSGSMIWNSSSTPRVKAGRWTVIVELDLSGRRCRRPGTLRAGPRAGLLRLRHGGRGNGLARLLPLPGAGRAGPLVDPLDEPLRGVLDDPRKVVGADRRGIGVGGGVQEVDRVRDAVPHGELDGVEVVSESARK